MLTRSEAERIDVPKPDPSLSKVSPAPSSPTTFSSSPTSASLKESTLLKRDEQSQTSSNQNALQLGKFVPLVTSIQRPVAVPASYVLPVMPYRLLHSSLHHTQDSLGQYDYSYTGDSSAKTESRSLDGTTRGAYSYIDPNGILQQVHYIADHNGFRVMATNLPEAKWWCSNVPRDLKSFVFEKRKKKKRGIICMRCQNINIIYNFYFWISNFLNISCKKKNFFKFRACRKTHFNKEIKRKETINWCSSYIYLIDFTFIFTIIIAYYSWGVKEKSSEKFHI